MTSALTLKCRYSFAPGFDWAAELTFKPLKRGFAVACAASCAFRATWTSCAKGFPRIGDRRLQPHPLGKGSLEY